MSPFGLCNKNKKSKPCSFCVDCSVMCVCRLSLNRWADFQRCAFVANAPNKCIIRQTTGMLATPISAVHLKQIHFIQFINFQCVSVVFATSSLHTTHPQGLFLVDADGLPRESVSGRGFFPLGQFFPATVASSLLCWDLFFFF